VSLKALFPRGRSPTALPAAIVGAGVTRAVALVGALALPISLAPAQTPPTAEAGAVVYGLRCSGCHGIDLHNTSGGQVFDLRRLRPTEHDRFVDSVTSGKDNMPSWCGILTAAEIEAIWAYIRATVDRAPGG
jgi:mono/diheme cytochrome c family protein